MVAEPCFNHCFYRVHLFALVVLLFIVMDHLGMLTDRAMAQDSIDDDADLVIFDNRIHSQSSTRRSSLSPAKRGKVEDHYPPEMPQYVWIPLCIMLIGKLN